MDFATANRAAFALLLVALTMGGSWLAGSLSVPDILPARPILAQSGNDEQNAPLPEGKVENGAVLANTICSRCHSFTPSGAQSAGPNLFGIFGRSIAREADYTYSTGLAAHGGTWDASTLSAWLRKPSAFSPGTRMSFMGLKDPQDRADVIAWLKTLH